MGNASTGGEKEVQGVRKLLTQLDDLDKRFSSFQEALSVAKTSCERKEIPSESLASELSQLNVDLDDINGDCIVLALEWSLQFEGTRNIDELRIWLENAESVYNTVHGLPKARNELGFVAHLRHKERQNLRGLAECRQTAKNLLSQLELGQHDEISELIAGKHVLSSLVYLVQNFERMSESDIEIYFETIAEKFGTPLALSASRGTLVSEYQGDDMSQESRLVNSPDSNKDGIGQTNGLPIETRVYNGPSPDINPNREAPPSHSPSTKSKVQDHQLFLKGINRPTGNDPVVGEFHTGIPVGTSRKKFIVAGLNYSALSIGLQRGDLKVLLTKAKHCPHCEPMNGEPKSAEGCNHRESSRSPSKLVAESATTFTQSEQKLVEKGEDEKQSLAIVVSQTDFDEPPQEEREGDDDDRHASIDEPQPIDLASLIADLDQNKTTGCCERVVLFLLKGGWTSLAFQLASYHQMVHPEASKRRLSLWLLRAVLLGPYVRGEQDNSEIARALANDVFVEGTMEGDRDDSGLSHTVNLLKIAACLKPALLAPSTGASEILRSARVEGLSNLATYVQIITEFAEQRWALDPNAFVFLKSKAVLDGQTHELQDSVKQWLFKAPQSEMIYGGTKKVLLHWLKPNELIWNLLDPIRSGEMVSIEAMKALASTFSDPVQIEREMHKAERSIGSTARDKTTGKALQKLQGAVFQAVEFAQEWARLCAVRNALNNEFSRGQAEKIRSDLATLHGLVIKELQDSIAECGRWEMLGALELTYQSVCGIRDLFNVETYSQVVEPSIPQLEQRDLLLIQDLRLNNSWELVYPQDTDQIYEIILKYLEGHRLDLFQSFSERLKSGDHIGSAHIIQLLRSYGQVDEAERLTALNQQSLRESRHRLQKNIDVTRNAVEEAVGMGLLRESERAGYIGQLTTTERALDSILNFPDINEQILAIREQIASKKDAAMETVRKRLDAIAIDEEDFQTIDKVLSSGDVLTANEYIDRVVRENALPEPFLVKDPFSEFFPDKAIKLEKFLEDPSSRHEVIRLVKERQNFCDLDLRKPLGAQTNRAADMLDAWFKVKESKNLDRNEFLLKILSHLSFNVKSAIKTKVTQNRIWLDIVTEPIRDRDQCPISTYGSSAEGHYRVLCVWDRPSEEDLLNEIGETIQGSPVIVFLFGRLSIHRRRIIARLSRDKRRTFVLVDDILMVYLAGEVGPRLPTLLKCALPFAFAEPYVTTAGLVPLEIFYGRSQERDSIINQLGSCFIYGGRQLGKTALLRHVERDFHKPEKGQFALWIDLKAEGIGYQRSVDDLATVIANEFKRKKILNLQGNINLEKLLEAIRNWLAEEPTRRILLLLDEADRFLESDAQLESGEGFRRTGRLKYLMDATQRRFKVVFAGLHNVQRMTRLANHPLAHYGEPICIGPLLNGADWRAARELIKAPLKAIGYDIADDLVTRIMSQTNYYPSLIQLYCQEMLRHVVQKQNMSKFNSAEVPPFKLSDEFVRDAYLSQNLRKAIRDRLKWTLQLDRRYEVIAYTIAHSTLGNDSELSEEGYSVAWVENEVMTWWPDGFKGKSRDEIKALLEEMVGLGILRDTDNGKFALRSPNVVLLMGTEDEILEELLAQREPPIEYEPNTFRAALTKTASKSDVNRRSPMTALQQTELRDTRQAISIVFGTEAAGLDDFALFARPEFAYFYEFGGASDKGAFNRQLSERDFQGREGTSLILLPHTVPWTFEWINDAKLQLQRWRQKGSSVRVCFLADPSITWMIIQDGALEGLRQEGHTTSLRPWDDPALRQWLEDCQYVDVDKSHREMITAATGNWPKLLYELNGSRFRNISWEQRIKEFAADIPKNKDRYLQWFGVSEAKRRVLANLCIVGDASANDLAELDSDTTPESVATTLEWAALLGICQQSNKGVFVLDPLFARLLAPN